MLPLEERTAEPTFSKAGSIGRVPAEQESASCAGRGGRAQRARRGQQAGPAGSRWSWPVSAQLEAARGRSVMGRWLAGCAGALSVERTAEDVLLRCAGQGFSCMSGAHCESVSMRMCDVVTLLDATRGFRSSPVDKTGSGSHPQLNSARLSFTRGVRRVTP